MVAPEDADLVREIFERIASGGTLCSEATRLNDLGVLPPSWRYPSAKRPPMKRWSPPTIRTIVRNTTYSGTHRITLSTGEVVEQTVPAIVDPNLQRRALAQLEENRRYSGGKKTRNYLLSGLITCEICGCSCSWRTNRTRGKTYLYYKCNGDHPLRAYRTAARHARNVSAPWLEETVWADVRRFLSAPGAVLERVRDQLASDGTQAEVEARHAELTDRLAAAHKERDRWLHLYTQGHLEEHELEKHLADLRVRLNNLKVLVSSVKEELEVQHEHARVAKTAEAWLMSLRERVEDIEEDSPEAYKVRRQLVQLLVERIVVGRDEDGGTCVRITYRFGPPEPAGAKNRFVTGVNNACPTHAHHTGIKSPTNSRTPTKE